MSSTATIGAMGARACRTPELLGVATAGATLSIVSQLSFRSSPCSKQRACLRCKVC
ncbi:hypothetical protein [Bradyrhizobium sp. CCBAU 11386]|uniref:hypothetical protein n=1 Tax=Bradyrhizobium sp. CCBAU 11386 TaxID=1630837 RepID=UPI002304AB69|nr:hypothetical protein [Bradyrhizobium sp. CCBAU 11386]